MEITLQPDLSILCVTKADEEVIPLIDRLIDASVDLNLPGYLSTEFVLIVDGDIAWIDSQKLENCPDKTVVIKSDGYIESVLDEAISHTTGKYILRVDDDESIPNKLVDWLSKKEYLSADHWKFARAHLWQDENHYITNSPLYPDHQTRLSVREKAGNRPHIHSGSPFGGGNLAPFPLFHHKFLVKNVEKRRKIVENYDKISSGMGTNFAVFSVPEDVIDEINVEKVENLTVF